MIVPASNTLEIKVNRGAGYANFNVPASVTPGESYYVYPMFKDEMGKWEYVQLPPDFQIPSFTINRPEGLALSKDLVVSNDGYVSADNFKVTFGVKNWADTNSSKYLILWVYPKEGGRSVTYFNIGTTTFAPGEEKTFELSYENILEKELVPGTDYQISLQNYTDGKNLGRTLLYFRDHVDINFDVNNDGQVTIADIVTFINLGEEAPDFDNNPETDDLLMLVNAVLEKQQQQ